MIRSRPQGRIIPNIWAVCAESLNVIETVSRMFRTLELLSAGDFFALCRAVVHKWNSRLVVVVVDFDRLNWIHYFVFLSLLSPPRVIHLAAQGIKAGRSFCEFDIFFIFFLLHAPRFDVCLSLSLCAICMSLKSRLFVKFVDATVKIDREFLCNRYTLKFGLNEASATAIWSIENARPKRNSQRCRANNCSLSASFSRSHKLRELSIYFRLAWTEAHHHPFGKNWIIFLTLWRDVFTSPISEEI